VQAEEQDELLDNVDVGEALDSFDSNEDDTDYSFDSSEDGSYNSFDSSEEESTEHTESEASSISNLLFENDSSGVIKDVVVVIDNSGSMIKNDPDFLATSAVSQFISGLDTQTQIAIVIFDQNVSLAVPLTPLSIDARDAVLSSLDKVNYKGLFTDSPAAIERAIYELKNNGRPSAQKSIVFLTDGIVDTGNPDVDLEKSKWLKEDLAADASDESIRVFGVAFTEDADFQLIQSIAQKTDGEYFRALQASDLQKVFKRINSILNLPPVKEVIQYADPDPEATPAPAPIVQQPVIIEVPQTTSSMGKEERLRSTIMIVAAAVLFITLLAIVYLMLRRGREMATVNEEEITTAFINDVNNHTGTSQYQLGQKPTMFGRVAGKDTEHLNFLVIPESTIGRRHALIEYKGYGFWINDQGSINGTFVNDQLITNEVCLKHGDKVRLHKFEFEFIMPELDDAGMTVVSNTTYAGQVAAAATVDAATVLKNSGDEIPDGSGLEPEFDITGGVEPEFELEMDDDEVDEDETIIREESGVDDLENETDPGKDDDETLIRGDDNASDLSDEIDIGGDNESEDETLIPDAHGLQHDQSKDDVVEEDSGEDETLMRGSFNPESDEEMTIRKEVDEAMTDFFDLDDVGFENKDDKDN